MLNYIDGTTAILKIAYSLKYKVSLVQHHIFSFINLAGDSINKKVVKIGIGIAVRV